MSEHDGERRIIDTGTAQRRIDPEVFAAALGAERMTPYDRIEEDWLSYARDNHLDAQSSVKIHWLSGYMSGFSHGFDTGTK